MLKIFLRISIFLGALFNAANVFAITPEETGLSAAKGKLPSGVDIPTLIGGVLGKVLGFTGTIFFVLVVYAGLMWMTSAGNEESVAKAKKILIAAIIGLIIVMSAYAITTFIGTSIG
ncbi:MAG: hypothetical protein NTY12_04875 [Candidatus Falkowbacteria bacterium]|nr:hypothetical protein [Candidatus Falkowbacteria bacterium]